MNGTWLMRVKHILKLSLFGNCLLSRMEICIYFLFCQIKLKKWVKTLQTMEKILVPLIYIFFFQSKKGDYIWKNFYEDVDALNWGIEGPLLWRKKNVLCEKEKKFYLLEKCWLSWCVFYSHRNYLITIIEVCHCTFSENMKNWGRLSGEEKHDSWHQMVQKKPTIILSGDVRRQVENATYTIFTFRDFCPQYLRVVLVLFYLLFFSVKIFCRF